MGLEVTLLGLATFGDTTFRDTVYSEYKLMNLAAAQRERVEATEHVGNNPAQWIANFGFTIPCGGNGLRPRISLQNACNPLICNRWFLLQFTKSGCVLNVLPRFWVP